MRYYALLGVVAAAIIGAGRLEALPIYQRMFQAKYKYKPDCILCHKPENWDLNGYGITFAKNGRNMSAFTAAEGEDPDGDGFTSGAEIAAKSNPGDPHSVPAHAGDWLANILPVQPPTKTLRELFPQADRFVLQEREVSAAARKRVEKKLGRRLRDEDLFPTFFEAYGKEGLLGSALYASSDGSIPGFFLVGFSHPSRKAPLRVIGLKMLLCSIRALRQPEYLDEFAGKAFDDLRNVKPSLSQYAEPSAAIVRAVENGALVIQEVWR